MTTRAEFIAQTLTWLKTPYHHQARLKGVGVDCIGLLVGVADELGIDTSNVPINYTRAPDPAQLFAALHETGHVAPAAVSAPGDIVLFRIGRQPTHFGLLTDYGFVHADHHFGVVEVPFDGKWRSRAMSYFKITHLEDA